MSSLIRPRVTRGAILYLDPLAALSPASLLSPLPALRTINFQFNPEKLTRNLTPKTSPTEGRGDGKAVRLEGPPGQTITVDLQLTAVDGLNEGDPIVEKKGILPQIALLELLVYPALTRVATDVALMALGTLEIVRPLAPLTLFSWGKRLLPVNIKTLSVTEDAFDDSLYPVQATVSLTMDVLTYGDVSPTNPSFVLSLVHQAMLESAAADGLKGS